MTAARDTNDPDSGTSPFTSAEIDTPGCVRQAFDALSIIARLTTTVAVVGGTMALTARRPKIPRPEDQPTMKVAEVALILGLSETSTYEAIKRDELPGLRVGRRVLVPTAALRRALGLDVGQEEDPDAAA